MILLDPDLDPIFTTATIPQRGTLSAAQVTAEPSQCIPSTRTLSRFLHKAQDMVRLPGQVSVLLTTDNAIRRLNRQFRGKNKATDVLSFPASEAVAKQVAGDLAISVPTALRQAKEQGHFLAIEIKVLMLHGLLHLAGYDHEADQGQMARRERLLRGRLNLPQGLIERTLKPSATTRTSVKARGKAAAKPMNPPRRLSNKKAAVKKVSAAGRRMSI